MNQIELDQISEQEWKDRRGTCPLELGRYKVSKKGNRTRIGGKLPVYKIWTSEDATGKIYVSDILDENTSIQGPLEVYIGDDNVMYTRQSICSETGIILTLPNGQYQSISYAGYQEDFDYGEQSEIETDFLSFQDFYKLDGISRKKEISKLGCALHSSFQSFSLDREFVDDDGELITNLYSLILNEVVIPDIRKICTGKGSNPLYQKYLVLFLIEQLFRENSEEIQTLFSHSTGIENFQKRITSLCRDNSFHGTRVSNGMVASVVFHMYRSFFTESVDELLEVRTK